jgi:ketosteroid isomerase-like protein
MPLKIRFVTMCALAVGAAQGLHAQQAQSVAPGQTQPPEIREFQGYEDQWSAAVVKADQYQMENLLSPLYVDISATGDVTTRNQQIAELFAKDGTEPVSMEQKVVSVRSFGDTAIVSGTYIVRWKNNNSLREERGIFTHVYNRQRNHWACVNAQRTAVVDLTPGKQKAQQKSNAPLPFHIPLLHQGADSTQPAAAQNAPAGPN